jgi:tellurite resistance protein TehA-like permease
MESFDRPIANVVPVPERTASKFRQAQRSGMTSIFRSFVRHGIMQLPPSYFSLVMATGIVSIASHFLGMSRVAYGFFLLNFAAFVLLWVLSGLRMLFFARHLVDDLKQHAVSPGYFTVVAGTGVFGVQCVSIAENYILAMWLWIFAIGLWGLITYAVFTAIIISPRKPSLARGLNGVWLISAVATQSIAVLGASIAIALPDYQEAVLFISLVFYLMGCMLYLNIIAMIFFRLTFVTLTPVEMTPPYWINMGATAITTQAGATLMLQGERSRLLSDLLPYIKGFTLFFWAAGTWWIPLLIILGVWTYGVRRVPMTYSPQFWGLVFPIGMYTASTFQLGRATGSDFLSAIPEVSIYLALLAWSLTFVGLLRQLGSGLLARQR